MENDKENITHVKNMCLSSKEHIEKCQICQKVSSESNALLGDNYLIRDIDGRTCVIPSKELFSNSSISDRLNPNESALLFLIDHIQKAEGSHSATLSKYDCLRRR